MVSPSRLRLLQAAATLTLAGAPLYWLQGRWLRGRVPRLDEAPGDRSGNLAGSEPTIRIAGLGESPMAAVGLADQSEGVMPRLAAELAAISGRQVEWRAAARSGATANFAREKLLPLLDTGPTHIAVIALGVNDCLRQRSARAWHGELARLLDAVCSRLDPDRIVLAGIPPMQHFPALPRPLSTMLGLRAALLDAVTGRLAGCRPGLLHAPMDFVERPDDLFCRDGFHPNARAQVLWARQLAETVTSSW
ncbi:SGNH/GDSL hydrolase family protein [Wenzhouxiangella sp. EGI_FJ10409]|uniref:SGNH/GDSL hydrolase family protein n=1 Tax=Wenzhouxiangella sp. EGI_FJ10409 TaxID=3243767 RepID=UPI0035E0BD29